MKQRNSSPSLAAIFLTFAKVGAFTFGSGYAMIPIIRTELVKKRSWVRDDEFAEMLSLAQTAPGAMSVNTAIFAGYRLRGLAGALYSCLGVVLPSFTIILSLAALVGRLGRWPLAAAALRGVRPAVVALILAAVIDLAGSLLRTRTHFLAAGILFAISLALNPHPALIIAAAVVFSLFLRLDPAADPAEARTSEGERGFILAGQAFVLFGAFVVIGALTFGGGYAMIPLIERIIITQHAWLTRPEFLEILALSQMTPGPIAINSATFVGYRINGFAGSIAATAGVVLPSLVIVVLMAGVFYRYQHTPVIQKISTGLRLAVVALLAAAVLSVGRESITSWQDAAMAGAVFGLLRGTKIHPIIVIVLSAVAGMVLW